MSINARTLGQMKDFKKRIKSFSQARPGWFKELNTLGDRPKTDLKTLEGIDDDWFEKTIGHASKDIREWLDSQERKKREKTQKQSGRKKKKRRK